MHCSTRSRTIQRLARQVRRFERSDRSPSSAEVLSTGIAPLDDLLPSGGIPQGTLLELLTASEGSGTGTLALLVASHVLHSTSGALLVIDQQRELYPPALGPLGVDLQRTAIIRPPGVADALSAMEQSLRCPGAAVALGGFGRLDGLSFRRLRMAAEHGNGLGLLLRPARFRRSPSWAHLRLLVEPLPFTSADERSSGRRLRVVLLRGGLDHKAVQLEIGDATRDVRPAAGLADSAAPLRATGT